MEETPEYYRSLLNKLSRFQDEIRFESRFHLKSKEVVEAVIDYFKREGTTVLKKGKEVYRARYDKDRIDDSLPISIENMGAPPVGLRTSGRLNPEGIAYLYCASDIKTALSEIRPWAGARLTVARGIVKEDLNMIDFHFRNRPGKKDNLSLNKQLFEIAVNGFFSARYPPDDKTGYVASQYIGEHIKHSGMDGVIYWSSLSKTGTNIALFDENKIQFVESRLYQIREVNYEYLDLWGQEGPDGNFDFSGYKPSIKDE